MEHQAITSIYEKIKTPYKIGPVLKFDDYLCDSPSVFRYEDAWYMSYIKIHKNVKDSGYESHLAKSTDLIHWEELFPIFERSEDDRWDSKQRACYAGFVDNRLDSYFEIEKIDNRYYFSYLGGNLNGYETDPLMMGEMEVEHILTPKSYHPFEKPVLSPFDKDARFGEDLTIYKGHFFKDSKNTLGYPYLCAYNAKGKEQIERIFFAGSFDGKKWKRIGAQYSFMEEGANITGDPLIFIYQEYYVMLYFVLKDGKTYNNFALSHDLVHWEKWDGKSLIESEYEWENQFAHKVSFVIWNGVCYHFYCATNTNGERFIALATSKQIK